LNGGVDIGVIGVLNSQQHKKTNMVALLVNQLELIPSSAGRNTVAAAEVFTA